MERSALRETRQERDEFPSTFDLEQQIEAAERRYAETRAGFDLARQNLRDLISRPGAEASAVLMARARVDAIAARCTRLRNFIDELEQRLDE